ncbi:MAG: hypothetical protein ACREA0_33785, partial [bacterium]
MRKVSAARQLSADPLGGTENIELRARLIAVLLAFVLGDRGAVAESQTVDADFQAGQRWSYKTRPQEPESTLIIGRVENDPKLGSVVHVSVIGLRLKNPRAEGGFGDVAAHLPISPKALRDSVIARVGDGAPAADFERGYAMWREARGGVFT